MLRPVLNIGHRALRRVCDPVPLSLLDSEGLTKQFAEMEAVMEDRNALGLAANQIGYTNRVVMMTIPEEVGIQKAFPMTTLINPTITPLSSEVYPAIEGCLSVPNMVALVYRPKVISVTYYDRQGCLQALQAHDFVASVIQHECDHLDGLLLTDRAYQSENHLFHDSSIDHLDMDAFPISGDFHYSTP